MGSSKQKNTKSEIFKKSVKPYFHPLKECYINYSQSKKLTNETEILALTPSQVKEKFGFEFLCDDLKKSTKNMDDCFEYSIEQIFSNKEKPNYSINTNILDSFILHPTSAKTGFGVSAAKNFEKGSIIAEYVGARTKIPFGGDTTYLFLTNYDKYDIDAKDYGNIARFFNHCPYEHSNELVLTANIQPIGCTDKKVTKIFFLALRDIKPSEPICFDYLDLYSFEGGIELLNAETYLPMVGYTESKGEL